ncbi:AIP3-domain-containing protein [Trichocladium antarcticum]|uniref:AIP3-domain-containing protein n=1 Tax=Trichocladium antarcticum TaxID=1450529 RepID=A0AAN6ZF75_9PEZI|nr:AIP3-domain-containing protein [Trichocladium antarcticum]
MNLTRSLQRRSPGPEPGPPPNVPPRSISPAVGVGTNRPVAPRSSASTRSMQPTTAGGSGSRNDGTKRANSSGSTSVPLSQIEKSVTHLLVATKQLLETLTQWSRGNATDTQVSDVYVRLGYEFNMACRAFTAINVDTSDLGNVPESLRTILEATLSQEASAESLEKYLPKIRDIIINLLHGLKRKQTRLRQKQQRERDSAPAGDLGGSGGAAAAANPAIPARTTSSSTMGSANSGLTTLLDEGLEGGYRPEIQRDEKRINMTASPTRRFLSQRDQSRGSINSEQSSLSSATMQNIPVLPPYPGDESMPDLPPYSGNGSTLSGTSANDLSSLDNFPPPPPPPKASQQSALAALQRGGDLERRASRRYSEYHISKQLGPQAPGIPLLSPQTTPIPNRGRDVRESMRAMQARDNGRHKRNTSSQSRMLRLDSSPVRVPSRVSEEPEEVPAQLPAAQAELSGMQEPDERFRPSATLNGPPLDAMPIMGLDDEEQEASATPTPPTPTQTSQVVRATTPDKPPSSFTSSPPATKDLTLFLQYKSKVKKFVLSEGYEELSIGRLQLAFIEKFSWNTQQNGADLPDIYIQDPVSGVRHELEDLSDIKDRTVLVLNVEALDEVKKHIDNGFGSIQKIVEDMKQNINDHGQALQLVSERQQETAKDVARLAAAPAPAMVTAPADFPRQTGPATTAHRTNNPAQLSEVQSLRRDLAVLRQTYHNFQSEVQGSMSALRAKANNVKLAAAKAAVPNMDGDSGRAYVVLGRKQLNVDSDHLVNKVDDLQDLVEDLRKDVVHRGVRPLPRQLEHVTRDITLLTKELSKMEEYMKKEKPLWTKIWEKELEDVCQGRDELRLVEDLVVDLRDDLEKASETFALVEQATKEQMKDASRPGGGGGGGGAAGAAGAGFVARQFSKGLSSIREGAVTGVDPSAAKEGVLGEVRALQPNHEGRLAAIERAEQARQKELESRRDNPLTKELANFVEEGRLKKSGGFEEVERARKAKDDRIRREVWERQNGIVSEPRPVAVALGALPLPRGDDHLGLVALEDIGAQHNLAHAGAVVVGERQGEGRAGVVVPDLGGVDAVPERLADGALEEVVDGGAGGAVAVGRLDQQRVPEGLLEVALLRVGDEAELGDDLLGGALADGLPGAVSCLVDHRAGERALEEAQQRQGGEAEEEVDAGHFGLQQVRNVCDRMVTAVERHRCGVVSPDGV